MYSKEFIELLNAVDDFVKGNDGHVWFRGVSNSEYELTSSLFRLNCNKLSDYLDYEKQFYNQVEINSTILDINDRGLELLYTMQHNGIKTRLLDWSGSLPIALFFAQWHWKPSKNARLWMINPIKLNELFHASNGIISPLEYSFEKVQSLDKSIAIYPMKNTKRIVAQHGFFTIQGNSLNSLENEEDGALLKEDYLKYIDLKFDLKQSIVDFLQVCNINYFSIYPDLEGLANYINNDIISPAILP